MTQSQLNEFNLNLNYLNELSKREINEDTEKWLLKNLPNLVHIFTNLIEYQRYQFIERVSINKNILGENRRIKEIKFLKYPPKEFVKKYGRCNMKNQSVLYASPIIMTALNEMRPLRGDLITKSKWKLKNKDKFLKVCPIFHFQPTNGTFNPRTYELEESFYKLLNESPYNEIEKEAVTNLSKFVAFHFSKYVNDNDRNYIFSAYFSNLILNEFENGTIDAINYPSVKERLSFENLAIKPEIFDENYELYEVKESIVTQDLTQANGIFMSGISDCKDFDFEKGTINWDKNILYQSKDDIEFFKKEFNMNIE